MSTDIPVYEEPHETVERHVPPALFWEYTVPPVFDPLHARWGLLLVSVETVGMYPREASSTVLTDSQFPEDASSDCAAFVTVVFVYRTRLRVLWSPDEEAETQMTWRCPEASNAIEGSAESYEYRSGLSPEFPDARMMGVPHVEPLVSELRLRMMRSSPSVPVFLMWIPGSLSSPLDPVEGGEGAPPTGGWAER